MVKEIRCPECNKIIGKMEEEGTMKKVYLYCKRCKKEIYIQSLEPKLIK